MTPRLNTPEAHEAEAHVRRFGEAVDRLREWEPSYRLEQRIAEARRRMGEQRWDELQAEWEASRG